MFSNRTLRQSPLPNSSYLLTYQGINPLVAIQMTLSGQLYANK